MTTQRAQQAANVLRELHAHAPLLLPNAWDAASAAAIEAAGASAIATTSAGISWAHGTPDGERLGREHMLQALSEIVAAVSIPVSADIEGGYGAPPEAVTLTVGAVLELGVAGINIEDSPGIHAPLREPSSQAARINAARTAAERADVPLWINARTDTFLVAAGPPTQQLQDTMARAVAYADGGADSLFVPGVVDVEVIEALAKGPLPINVMIAPGAPDIASLARAGASRISTGSAIAQTAYGLAARAATEMLTTGTYQWLTGALDYGQLNELLNR